MDRRRFFKIAAGTAGALAVARQGSSQPMGMKRISIVRDAQAVSRGIPDAARTRNLLDKLIRIHFDVADPVDVFRQLFPPGTRVGIKINCLSGKRLSTHQALVDAVVANLLRAEIPPENILIWERLNLDLRQAGYKIVNPGKGIACAGCDVLGYDTDLTVHRSIGSLLARPVSTLCNAQINLPVLKDHGIVGVTLGMKNLFGAIHNPNKYHHNHGDPFVADLYSHPDIGGKVKLTILDALEFQCEGGPPYQPDWCEDFGGLLTSDDPVALDRYGWQMIEKRRAERGLPSLAEAQREPVYIHTAANLGLGTDDLTQVEVREN